MTRISHARVTKAQVDRLAPGEMIRDNSLVGFGVRRQKGAPVFFLQKRIGARVRWITIGRYGSPWTPDSARQEAYRLLGQVAEGTPPVTRPDALAAKPAVRDAVKVFLAEHGTRLKPSSHEKYTFLINACVIPELGDRLVADVNRADVMKLHARLAKTPQQANYAIAVLSKFMTWSEEHGHRPMQSNPCFRLKKYRAVRRQRYLSPDEFTRLGTVLDRVQSIDHEHFYFAAAVRLLLLSGARLGEILTLAWKSVDFDRQLLLLPDSKTGQKVIRLNPQTLDLLRSIPRVDGNPYVIIGRREGSHLINLQKPWRRIRREAGLDDVHLHDLRHTFASVAAAANGSLLMIGRLLGHSQTQTTQRYAHLSNGPVDQLNKDVGDKIAAAIGMRGKGQCVE